MGHRFFIDTPVASKRATLVGSEAHHVKNVMRAVVGDQITLFDGSGKEFTARIEQLSRSEVDLTITSAREVNREADRQIIVGVTLPKGERQRWLVEKLTELGVDRMVPLQSDRSVVHPKQRSLEKLSRFVVEASKQCGRNRLMQVAPLVGLDVFLAAAPAEALRWFADPVGRPACGGPFTQHSAYLAVGPEGGFSPQEQAAAEKAGWQCVSLGPRILRIETACTALAALVSSDLHRNDHRR